MGNGAGARTRGSGKYRRRLEEGEVISIEAESPSAFGQRVGRSFSSSSGISVGSRRSGTSSGFSERSLADARGAAKFRLSIEAEELERLWSVLNSELRRAVAAAAEGDRGWTAGLQEARVQTRAQLLAALLVRDSTQLGLALHKAAGLGMDLLTASSRAALEEVLAQEEIEGLWRCLASSLKQVDQIGIAFWLEEADSKKIEVPAEVRTFWAKAGSKSSALVRTRSKSTERRTLLDWDYQDVLEARVAAAHAEGDARQLQRLVQEAEGLGADPGLARAALVGLEAEEGEARGSTLYCGGTFADPELAALSRWSARALKEELERFGVDFQGIIEKQELVQLLASVNGGGSPHRRRRRRSASGSSADQSPERKPRRDRSPDRKPRRRDNAPAAEPPPPPPMPKGVSPPRNCASAAGRNRPKPAASDDAAGAGTSSGAGGGRGATTSDGRSGSRPKRQQGNASGGSAADDSGSAAPPPPAARPAMSRADALQCLGLGPDPSLEVLKKAYKKAAMQWHPDRPHNHEKKEEATQKFQEARKAYEYLAAAAS
eukprot:TRINITY_DN9839_c0_g1_i1.p1 TRINITY_DN9839_c0_g1~~TRINITY_DN9839_c0_g1_i1.p1  ORF type:complete len:596 (-),score=156.22 TRINITY_DN9839_c0_g1_i1:197-1834(-)